MKSRFPRKGWLLLLIVFGLFAVAYLSSFIFHQGSNIRFVDLILPNSDGTPANLLKKQVCADRFCSVTCDPGYAALSGRCSSSGGWQWNLSGVSPNYKSWYCFDSSLLNLANLQGSGYPVVTAEAACVKVGNSLPAGNPPKVGNYIIDAGEVCDSNNTGGVDCTAFTARQYDVSTDRVIDVPLCNGYLSCSANGQLFDISHCQFCNGAGIGNGVEVGNNNRCNPGTFCECFPYDPITCPFSNNDPSCGNSIIEAGEECERPNVGFSTGFGDFVCMNDCKIAGLFVPSDTCGDGVVQGTEECDPPGTTALTGSSALCFEECDPPGTTALTGSSALCFGGYCVYETATCQLDCTWKTSWPACPGLPIGFPDPGDDPLGGSCTTTGPNGLPGDV
jgi:hypothetical protein